MGNKHGFLTWLCSRFYTPLPDSDIPDALTRQSRKRGSEPWKRVQTSLIGRVGGCKIHTGVGIA